MGRHSKRSRGDEIDDLYRKIKKLRHRRRRSSCVSSSRSFSSDRDMAVVSGRNYGFYGDEDSRSDIFQAASVDLRSNHSSLSLSVDNQNPEVNVQSPIQSSDLAEVAEVAEVAENAEVAVLDEETSKLLGESAVSTEGFVSFHAELSSRVLQWLQDGLKKEEKLNLLVTYPRKGSVLLEAPILNPEIEASTNESVRKRDKYFVSDQNTVGSAISAIGEGLSLLLVKKELGKEDRDHLIKCQLDAIKLLSEVHLQSTKARKAYIYPGLDKKAKSVLEKTKPDECLFGSDLSEMLRTAKTMEKVGLTLKPSVPVKKAPPRASSSGNWRGPSGKNLGFSQAGNRPKSNYRHPFQPRNQGFTKSQGQPRVRDGPPNPPQKQ